MNVRDKWAAARSVAAAAINERNFPYWADPFRREPGKWNTSDGGRGLYWEGPDGHVLEIITRPYGSGG